MAVNVTATEILQINEVLFIEDYIGNISSTDVIRKIVLWKKEISFFKRLGLD